MKRLLYLAALCLLCSAVFAPAAMAQETKTEAKAGGTEAKAEAKAAKAEAKAAKAEAKAKGEQKKAEQKKAEAKKEEKKEMPKTGGVGGASLLALGAGALLVGMGLLVRRMR